MKTKTLLAIMALLTVCTLFIALVCKIEARPVATQAVARTSGIITVRGERVPYLSEGEGEPCIVTGVAPTYPPLFSERLKKKIRFLYVDFKGSWTADPTRKVDTLTMDDLVQEIDDVRRAFGLERVCLTGHSSTGLVAIEYLARHPERVSRLLLVGVHPFWNQKLFDAWNESWEHDASPERKAVLEENKKRMPDSLLKTLSPRDAFAMRYVRAAPRLFLDPNYNIFWAMVGHQISSPMLDHYWAVIVKDYDTWSRLTNNTTPIFLGLGRYDNAVPYQTWQRERDRKNPSISFVTFEKSAHFPMLEEPEVFDDAVLAWLAKTSKKDVSAGKATNHYENKNHPRNHHVAYSMHPVHHSGL
jgi:proline iminopeptidase